MKENKDIESSLILKEIVFDKIEFNRLGFKNKNEPTFEFQSKVAQKQNEDIYKVTLIIKGEKEKEYTFEISLSGFFSFKSNEKLPNDLKNTLITQNSVAILMPYLRSEISLLTAQPNVECIVLPVFNINNLLKDNDQ